MWSILTGEIVGNGILIGQWWKMILNYTVIVCVWSTESRLDWTMLHIRGSCVWILWLHCDMSTVELLSFPIGLQSWDSGWSIYVQIKVQTPSFKSFGHFLCKRQALEVSKRQLLWRPAHWKVQVRMTLNQSLSGHQSTY